MNGARGPLARVRRDRDARRCESGGGDPLNERGWRGDGEVDSGELRGEREELRPR